MIVGVSLGHHDVAQADRWIQALDPAPGHACTHLVQQPRPHVAVSIAVAPGAAAPASDPAFDVAAAAAAAAHGVSGRAVRYAGVDRLVGVVTVADVLAVSAIEEIVVVGGGAVDPGDEIATGDFVRPHWVNGVLTLHVTPAAQSRYTPFEVPRPTPCCADH
jgi:hypothetical protein